MMHTWVTSTEHLYPFTVLRFSYAFKSDFRHLPGTYVRVTKETKDGKRKELIFERMLTRCAKSTGNDQASRIAKQMGNVPMLCLALVENGYVDDAIRQLDTMDYDS